MDLAIYIQLTSIKFAEKIQSQLYTLRTSFSTPFFFSKSFSIFFMENKLIFFENLLGK